MKFDAVLRRPEVVAVTSRQPRPGVTGAWPQWCSPELRQQLAQAGITNLWQHQAQCADSLFQGNHTLISTPTGSGKTLGYLLPILAATCEGKVVVPPTTTRTPLIKTRHTALYLAPTKALAHDQVRAAKRVAPTGWPVMTLDGDSSQAERKLAREQASYLLTNPDMLHFSVLPHHQRWAAFLGALRYIVVDEAHRYQGIFGAHVAQVLRRLRRLAAHYGASPAVAFSSATAPNAADFAAGLAGVDEVNVVDEDSSSSSGRTIALWRPTATARSDTAALLRQLSDGGLQTIAFVPSRLGAELVSVEAQKHAQYPEKIASYRSGYLAADRRTLEAQLHSGKLRALASTNALELGVDIAGIDVTLLCGYPGKMTSFWQQAGRAGRGGQDALVVMVASENPLDAYFLEHPELIFSGSVEPAVLYPDNPRVLGPHLAAAAYEVPLSSEDEQWFGPSFLETIREMVRQRVLRDRTGRYFWTRLERPHDFFSLRSAGAKPFDIIDSSTGQVVGIIDEAAVDRTLHPGAVYLHQGRSFLVEELDRQDRYALVQAAEPRYYTQPQSSFDMEIIQEKESRPFGAATLHRGEVRLDSQVLGYLRRDETTHEVWDSTPLEMPMHQLTTQSVWLTVPQPILKELGWSAATTGAAAHAIEHTAIGLLPAFAPCDRWDIGGLSTALHPDTGLATIFVHDGMAGGAGFAYRGYDVAESWLEATLERLSQCSCLEGCPACVVSPKCGNANQMLDKQAAAKLLGLLLN